MDFPYLFEVPDVAGMKILVAHEIFVRHVDLLDSLGKPEENRLYVDTL